MRRIALFLSALAIVSVAACGKDNSGELPTTPSTPGTSNGLTISFDSGQVDVESLTVSTQLPVRVHVTQAGGAAVSGAAVTWTITNGKGSLSSASTVTDAKGATSINWTLSDTAGLNSVAAGIAGASITLNKVGLAGPPTTIAKVTTDSSAVVAGASVPLIARVTDKTGNPARGATVTWTTTAGSVSTASVTSGTTGNAGTNLTTTAPGTYLVTATLAGKGSVTFKVVGF